MTDAGMNAEYSQAMIGPRAKERREALGLTQAEVARRMGIKQPTVAHIEAGRATVGLSRLLKLAEALECSPADLTATR